VSAASTYLLILRCKNEATKRLYKFRRIFYRTDNYLRSNWSSDLFSCALALVTCKTVHSCDDSVMTGDELTAWFVFISLVCAIIFCIKKMWELR
jgi:hypothetical protein